MTQLDPTGRPIRVGPFVVRSPGVTGRVETRSVTSKPTRGGTAVDTALVRALEAHTGRVAGVLELVDAKVVASASTHRRRGATDAPAIEVDVPAPATGEVHALLGVDGRGDDALYRWSFPPPLATAGPRRREGQRDTFTIPLASADGGTTRRGLLGTIGRKVVGWVVMPLARKAVGKGGQWVAARWEADNRPARVRSFTDKNWNQNDGPDLTAPEWDKLGGGRALMLVHGTLDRASSSFGGMKPAMLRDLHQLYGGRVFAYNHPTLSVDPHENAVWLAKTLEKRLPARTKLDIDILCSSRGGLVSRELGVWPDKLPFVSTGLEVRRIVMMAAPNAGTPLADAKHDRAFIDTYTNLLRFLPDNGVTDVLEVVLEIVKEIAAAILEGLPGLQAMNPTGNYLKTLNTRGGRPVEYRSLASDYEPGNDGFGRWASDVVIDPVFNHKPNDLVVPVDGVWKKNGAPGFPLAPGDHMELAGQHITHGGYFRSPDAVAALERWLVP